MSIDQSSRMPPVIIAYYWGYIRWYSGQFPTIAGYHIHETFFNFVPKRIIFKQIYSSEGLCRGFEVRGLRSWGRLNTPPVLITYPSVKNGFGVINVTLQTKRKDNGKAVKKVFSSV